MVYPSARAGAIDERSGSPESRSVAPFFVGFANEEGRTFMKASSPLGTSVPSDTTTGAFRWRWDMKSAAGRALLVTLSVLLMFFAITPMVMAAPAANEDQCANGGVPDLPAGIQCIEDPDSDGNLNDNAWQNGNLNANQAHYLEGDSVPYRATMSDLENGQIYWLKIGDLSYSS